MRGLGAEELAAYQRATEELLAETGFAVLHPDLRARARAAGAVVSDADQRVRLPVELTRSLLSQAPSQYEIAGSSGRCWTVGGQERHALAIVTDPWIVDWDSGRPRRPCLDDVIRHTRIAQQLETVAGVSLMDFPVSDVAGEHSNLHAMEAHLLEHDKHTTVMAASPASMQRWLRLQSLLRQRTGVDGRLMSAGVAVLSPLTLSHGNGELLLAACSHDMPVVPTVCPMAGTTAPYTRSGVLLQANAEAVFMAAMTQIVRRGHPFLYAIGPSRTDMRDGADLYYTLDKVQWKIAAGQLGCAYRLPTGSECGGSATCAYDMQSGAESALFMQAAWESGAHWLAGIGSCGNAICMSAETMVVQDAWMSAARFLASGLPAPSAADRRALASGGPGAHFMADELTLSRLRTGEFFSDPLFDYDGGHLGSTPLPDRAHSLADDLATRSGSPHAPALQNSLRSFFQAERSRS